MREKDKLRYPLTIAYLGLNKPSQNTTLPLQDKKKSYLTRFSKLSRNVHVSVGSKSLPYCRHQMIYNWANNSLTSKGYEQNMYMQLSL